MAFTVKKMRKNGGLDMFFFFYVDMASFHMGSLYVYVALLTIIETHINTPCIYMYIYIYGGLINKW